MAAQFDDLQATWSEVQKTVVEPLLAQDAAQHWASVREGFAWLVLLAGPVDGRRLDRGRVPRPPPHLRLPLLHLCTRHLPSGTACNFLLHSIFDLISPFIIPFSSQFDSI